MTFSILIPTYNGEPNIRQLFDSLCAQDVHPNEIVVIDSSSKDRTLELVRNFEERFDLTVKTIPGSQFNHGGTRNLAARSATGEILVFMSQDIILQGSGCLSALLEKFRDASVASVYGKQVPYPYHHPVNRFQRHYNYGEKEIVKGSENASEFGIKAYFNSNSFSSYRKDVFDACGGFDSNAIFGEDTVFTKKLLESGYRVVYTPDAVVMHSHDYSLPETFRRYFDLGVCHRLLFRKGVSRKSNGAEGTSYLAAQMRWLASQKYLGSIPFAVADLAVKGVGYKLGFYHHLIPHTLKGRLSMNKAYWKVKLSTSLESAAIHQ